jgi:4-hydroxy-tetrahydrodipicolinate synthase
MKVLRGIIPPVPTPLKECGGVDREAFFAIAQHLSRGGCDGAFVLGSTGECASLPMVRRLEAISAAAEAFRGIMPLLVGIGDCSLQHSLMLADHAANAGVDAVVVNAPSYYEISAVEMRCYLDCIMPRLALPVMLYNMPWLTGHSFDESTLRHAIDFPGLVGFKDSSADVSYLRRVIEISRARPELCVLVGNDFLFLEGLRMGVHGAVAGGAILYPRYFRSLIDAFVAGDVQEAEHLQWIIRNLGETIFESTGQPTSVFASIKGGLAALGLCRAEMMPPIQSCTPEMISRFAKILRPPATV